MTEDEKLRREALQLFSIEIRYEYDNEAKLHRMRNMLGTELQSIRATIFNEGLAVEIARGHWAIVPPSSLGKVDIFLQSNFFE